MESPASTTAVEQQPAAGRLRILAEKPAADMIAAVVAKLPNDVQERIAETIIFVWPPAGDSCTFFDGDTIGDRLVICLAPHVADFQPKAQASVILTEIARAFINPPTQSDQPRTGPTSAAGSLARQTNEQIQRLVNSWA